MDIKINIDPLDEELNQFERDVRQLKIEYEQFFGGGKKRPPADIEWRLELMIKRHGDRGAAMNYGQRFRYFNLTQTYARYREIFRKRLRKYEEGGAERHFGAAARAIEAERRQKRLAQLSSVTVACADPIHEPQKVDRIYEAFRACLERSGQSTSRLSRESFDEFLMLQVEQLRKRGSGEIEFVVGVEDGKARLKARIKS
jgi:hypothetical protein